MPEIGNVAATVARQLLNDFPSFCFGLLVGIGGGVPGDDGENDVRLGDMVVSQPTDTFGGVVQYDLGKRLINRGFERPGQLISAGGAQCGCAEAASSALTGGKPNSTTSGRDDTTIPEDARTIHASDYRARSALQVIICTSVWRNVSAM